MISPVRVSSIKECCGLFIRMDFSTVIDTFHRISLEVAFLSGFLEFRRCTWILVKWGLDVDPAFHRHEFRHCAMLPCRSVASQQKWSLWLGLWPSPTFRFKAGPTSIHDETIAKVFVSVVVARGVSYCSLRNPEALNVFSATELLFVIPRYPYHQFVFSCLELPKKWYRHFHICLFDIHQQTIAASLCWS